MTVAVVEKIFMLLEALARASQSMPLRQLAELTDLPKPTAYRLLQTLQQLGYVVRAEGGTDYLLGYRIQDLARSPVHQQLIDAAKPVMNRLHSVVNETVNLGVRDGLMVRYIEYLETTRPLRLIVRPGQTDSLFTTALGRAILAVMPKTEVDRLLVGACKEAVGSEPVLRLRTLQKAHAATISRGWAEESGETVPGVSCLAVSLRPLGYPYAAISVSVPIVRFDNTCRRAVESVFRQLSGENADVPAGSPAAKHSSRAVRGKAI